MDKNCGTAHTIAVRLCYQMMQNITDSSFGLEYHVVVVREAAIDSYISVRVESC